MIGNIEAPGGGGCAANSPARREQRERRRPAPGSWPTLPRPWARKLWRAIIEFGLIKPGDRVLVGLSGGKDSTFLLFALAAIRRYSAFTWDLGAATLEPGFAEPLPEEPLAAFCRSLGVPFYYEKAHIGQVLLAAPAATRSGGENACALCAHLRRGALSRLAVAHGYNRLALAHHRDDAIETLLLSLFYSGLIKTFLPLTPHERSGITVIRPLVYFTEAEIKGAVKLTGFTPIASPCPFNGRTQRQRVKELWHQLVRENRSVYTNLFAALRRDAVQELWPPEPSRRQLRELHRQLFQGDGGPPGSGPEPAE